MPAYLAQEHLLSNAEDTAALHAGARPLYAVPALEKALDIIELLAGQAGGLSGSQIALELDRSSSEIFRVLQVLERRHIIERRQPGDRFGLTVRLLELGLAHPTVDRLLTTAIPVMQEVAEAMRQSCHLAVRNLAHILIVAQVPSPGAVGFNVRRGARFPLTASVSGRVLLSFRNPTDFRLWMRVAGSDPSVPPPPPGLDEALARIRARGHDIAPSAVTPGVTDVGAPVIDDSGDAVAALTVPFFATSETRVGLGDLPGVVCEAARGISAGLGGRRKEALLF